ncbi:MAG TPA: type II and III secretion system protein, partial [Chthoniobacteraceae bacterium]|nr:type II and III secretion system protein [Chthoniobacteraceae bacterium]
MIKPPLLIITLAGIAALSPLVAGAADVDTVARQEEARREADLQVAEKAIAEGDKLFKTYHYDQAVQQYQLAADTLAESPYAHNVRSRAVAGLALSSTRLAEQRITEGRFEDARASAKTALKYDPNYKPAIELLAHMEDAGYFNTTVGEHFEDKVHEVQRLFIEAKGFYDTARFDLAYKRCDQILDIDRYNKAARELQEDILAAKSRYATEAYDETRSLMMWQITSKWETNPRKYINREAVRIQTFTNTNNTEYIQNKLNRIIIPQINLRDATVRDAIEYLRRKSIDLDTTESDPAKKGVNIVLKLSATPSFGGVPAPAVGVAPPVGGDIPGVAPVAVAPAPAAAGPGEKKITLSLTNIPLA